MLLTDYFRYPKDSTWDIAKQSGVSHGVIRLPETGDFDLTDKSHWQTVYDDFMDYGLKPVIIEPMPNELHDHIKAGDEKRDESIEKVIKMFPIMEELDIRTICFNFMAHIGWYRTKNDIIERGGARVTGFDINDFKPVAAKITKEELWANYEYFIKAVIPYAEKHGIKLALHPDDPPRDLGGVSRIMTSAANIDRAVNGIVKSDSLGITMCQATYHIMGEKLEDVIPRFKDKIMFIHFRNTRGNINAYRETYHDNGEIDMAKVMKLYTDCSIDVPIRVDHVPTMVGEDMKNQGYDAIGRYFAIGYLKGILDATK
ncbi:MAG: mannonate dehydratase [Ruminococcaceae bacterium]|nr:mannonate dehydratase [Oscillospiraceae bacterium]